jgi:predicted transcriptional regulator
MEGRNDSATTEGQDAATESAVLQQLLAIHPTQVTVAELVRELNGPEADFAERDAIARAVRDLAGVGLVHRNGDLLTPTRAALRLAELLDG